jgi:branched-chain amino acid transport system substrate-binding protein
MNRRDMLLGATASAGALALGPRPAHAEEPIRIGLLAPLTGVVAAGGKDMVDGWNLWWDKQGKKVAGREVEVIVEDDGSNPDTALNKARRLVQQRNVHMLVGNILANAGLAVAEYVKGTGTPYFIPIVAADDLTQRQRIPNVIRVAGFSASQITHPIGDYALKQGHKKVVTIGQDYAFGHEQIGGFVQVFTAGGGQVLQQIWHPLNTADFSPYLAQIQGAGADLVYCMENGADAVRFLDQWSSFAMKDKLPLMGSQNLTDQSVIRGMNEQPLGIVTTGHFAEGSPVPATKAFVAEYEKAYGKLPAMFSAAMYSGGLWITRALEQVGGKVEDKDKFLAAIRALQVPDTAFGPSKLDEYGNPVWDIVIRKVVKRDDGKLWNVPIQTYPQVSQFWTYKPEDYLKKPVFSRNFQDIAGK